MGNNQQNRHFCLVKFWTGSNTEITQNARVKVYNDIRTSKNTYIKQINIPYFQLCYP